MNLQKSHDNTARELSFYINGSTIDAALDQTTPELPKEYQCHCSRRIANVVPEAPDKFTLTSATNLLLVQAQIQAILEATLTFFYQNYRHQSPCGGAHPKRDTKSKGCV